MNRNIFSEDFWKEQTDLKSKIYLYRVTRKGSKIKVKVLEANKNMPISEITRTLGGLPHGVVNCKDGIRKARVKAMDDFVLSLVEKYKAKGAI